MNRPDAKEQHNEIWWHLVHHGPPVGRRVRHLWGLLPTDPRCKFCNRPFHGLGGRLLSLTGFKPSNMNPRWCNGCEILPLKLAGGAEVTMTMLFADVRGSTSLAEQTTASNFSRLISRFYTESTRVLVRADAWIDRLAGDQVIGFFLPGYAGPNHAQLAVQAARDLLEVTGHTEPDGPWIPVGVGVHTGQAYFGVVGDSPEMVNVTALGDPPNIAARLSSRAAAGEILVSDDAAAAAGVDVDGLEKRVLQLKGHTEPVSVNVISVGSAAAH